MESIKNMPGYVWATAAAAGAYSLSSLYSMFTKKDLNGKIVVITGAGSGIGRLMSLRLAKLGCYVLLWDLSLESAEKVAVEIIEAGGKAKAYQSDVSDRETVYRLANQIKEEVGPVDILINNAGIVSGKKILDVPDGLAEKTMDVNTTAHFWTIKAFLPGMLERNSGHIVGVASAAGILGTAGLVDYCASKFGAVGLMESIRLEIKKLGKYGVRTTVVCPFYINTGMFDGAKTRFPLILPMLEPEYVADKIVEAIQTGQQVLCMPRMVYLCPLFRMLPVDLMDSLCAWLGISSSMDDFKGRQAETKKVL
eukprot:comp20244_c0_seq1/m.25303 comp20244_c0_seq1/g.25303  ORF comp20244_c0_seq1/g.25303 comp20244_c0_seq1/m.25303 type:complete len:309 (-) comp20244_c0_seq1:737-1663(-)